LAAQIVCRSLGGMITGCKLRTFFDDDSFAQRFVDRMHRFTLPMTNAWGEEEFLIPLSLIWVVYHNSELSLAATRIYEEALAARYHEIYQGALATRFCQIYERVGAAQYHQRDAIMTTKRDRLAAVRLVQICIGLQTLCIPTLLLLEIFDESVVTDWTMYKKWQLIVNVRHFLDRKRLAAGEEVYGF
jgi:hypothetical protein